MYQFKYTYSNGVEEFSRIFTLEEIGQGWHFYVISDNPLLKDYRIVDRKLSTTQKDINGIEIFDGDTCECWGGENWEGKWEYYGVYEVKWQGVGFDMVKDNCGYCWGMNNAIEYIKIL